MVASLVIIVCLVVIFGVQPGSGREQSFREIPEQETFDRRRYIFFRSALAHVSEPATFVNPNSPQSQALRWLVYEDQTISVPDGHQDLQSITAIDGDFQLRLTQRYALMVLAFSTNGALWRGIYPWERQFETMECDSEFKGVECDNKTGEVSKIDLATRNLGGTIPDELGKSLTRIRVFSSIFRNNADTLILSLQLKVS